MFSTADPLVKEYANDDELQDPLVKEYAGAASALPSNPKLWLRRYQGTWVLEPWVPGIIAIQRGFVPRAGDVVLASAPKCGTTWLKALAFATMARRAHPPAGHAGHPLLSLNQHDCVPFMEQLFAAGWGRRMDALPSPRLMATHMHHSILPSSISNNPDCEIVYICREPKDMVVSMWHFRRRIQPDLSFSDVFEAACEGRCLSGPIWDHVLGYWNASKASPETVLFLRYEEMLRDPAGNVKRLAQFVGQPFSPTEEEAEVVADVVRLCSFETLKNLEVNKASPASSTGARAATPTAPPASSAGERTPSSMDPGGMGEGTRWGTGSMDLAHRRAVERIRWAGTGVEKMGDSRVIWEFLKKLTRITGLFSRKVDGDGME